MKKNEQKKLIKKKTSYRPRVRSNSDSKKKQKNY